MKKAALLFAIVLAVGATFAQDPGPMGPPPGDPGYDAQTQADPPGRVARLNYIQGSISFQPAGTQDWVDANPNRPLTTGDNLWADQNSRGEVHVGSTAIRLSGQTGLSILNLTDQAVQIEVPQGSIELHVRDFTDQDAYEVDTPNLAMTILRPGDYRIDVDPNGMTSAITLRSGSGEVTAAGRAYSINAGQQMVFSGNDQLTYDSRPLPPRDDFDNWAVSRDQIEDRSISARYVSRDVTGYDDLDRYGVWREEPDYGPVWIPSGVPIGWAPYHYGHWVYVAPWGWTWVEDEPWGFAPFHYGRWALVAGSWGWVPGPVVAVGVHVRPVYAPALVGFVGGGGVSVSFAIGGVAGVGWFPLGPRDVWVPAYRASPRYVERVNITNTRVVNVTQVRNVYVNRTTVVNNYTYAHNTVAVTAVSRETFVNGAPVSRSVVRVNADAINHPQVMREARLEPTARSSFGPAVHARAIPPAALANRTVVTRMTPSSRAVAVGHTQPLVNERAAYRPSNPRNGGQFERGPQPNNQGQPNGGNSNAGRPNDRGFGGNRGSVEQRSNNSGGFQPGQNGNNNAPNNRDNRDNRTFQPPARTMNNAAPNATPNSPPNTAPTGGAQPESHARPTGTFDRRGRNADSNPAGGAQPGNSNVPNGGGNAAGGNMNSNRENRGYRQPQPHQGGSIANPNPGGNPNRDNRPHTQPNENMRSNGGGQPPVQPQPQAQPQHSQPQPQPRENREVHQRPQGGGNPPPNAGGNPGGQPQQNRQPQSGPDDRHDRNQHGHDR